LFQGKNILKIRPADLDSLSGLWGSTKKLKRSIVVWLNPKVRNRKLIIFDVAI